MMMFIKIIFVVFTFHADRLTDTDMLHKYIMIAFGLYVVR